MPVCRASGGFKSLNLWYKIRTFENDMKPLDHKTLAEIQRPDAVPVSSLPPELVALICAIARMAARQDYDYFCRTGQVFGYDNSVQE